jgi:hypothetical protein
MRRVGNGVFLGNRTVKKEEGKGFSILDILKLSSYSSVFNIKVPRM